MLLTHTSSIQNNDNIIAKLTKLGDPTIQLGTFLYEYLTPGGKYYDASKNFSTQTPGIYWSYCGVGASLAAYLVEVLAGVTFDEYCRDSIFVPMQMTHTAWFLKDLDTDLIAHPYSASFYDYGLYSRPIYPAGLLRTTLPSLAKFLIMNIRNGELGGISFLDTATINQIRTVHFSSGDLKWGLIWMKWDGLDRWGHFGEDRGVLTAMFLEENNKTGIIILTNEDDHPIESVIEILFNYAHLYGNIYALKSSVIKPFAQTSTDSVLFQTTFSNINNHLFTAHLIYTNYARTQIDSLTLFDDGLHGDMISEDGIYGGYIPPQKDEDFYSLSVSTIDKQTNKYFNQQGISRFTTVGPVMVDSVAYSKRSNSFFLKPYVSNHSKISTVSNVKINILCSDSWATNVIGIGLNLPDIAPSTTVSSTSGTIGIDSTFPGYFNLKFEIMSDDWTYWTDSMQVIISPTGIDEHANKPLTFNLEQNYPNPFNPTTSIQYSIASSQFVKLKVFNVLGQEIQTLVNAEKPAGNYQVAFNAADLPSGVYFYRIQAGSFNQVRKMILIK